MSDLNMLKTVTEHGADEQAAEAVSNVLYVLHETPEARVMWVPVYEAIKSAYIGSPDWGDEEEVEDGPF